jgi:hypothetical protein
MEKVAQASGAMQVEPPECQGWKRHKGLEGDEKRRSKKRSCLADVKSNEDLPRATYLCCEKHKF